MKIARRSGEWEEKEMDVPLERGVALLLRLLDASAVSLGVLVVGGGVLALGH